MRRAVARKAVVNISRIYISTYLLSTAVAGLSHTNTDISVTLLSSALRIHTIAVTTLHLNTAVWGHLTSHHGLVVSLNPFYLFYDTHNPNLS